MTVKLIKTQLKRSSANCIPFVKKFDRSPLMLLGSGVLHSFGLWPDTLRVDEDWATDQPFLAHYFSKPLVPTVRENIPDSADLAGKHPVMKVQECKTMSKNHPISMTLNVIRSLLQQPCQVVAYSWTLPHSLTAYSWFRQSWLLKSFLYIPPTYFLCCKHSSFIIILIK